MKKIANHANTNHVVKMQILLILLLDTHMNSGS